MRRPDVRLHPARTQDFVDLRICSRARVLQARRAARCLRCCASKEEPQEDKKPFQHPELDGAGASSSTSSSFIPDALPFMGADTDWREFRAKLVASERAATSPQGTSTLTRERDPTTSSSSSGGAADAQGRQVASEEQQGSSISQLGAQLTRWAHRLPRPEKGCLLLANPMMFRNSQEYFYQAVILMLGHDERGSYGIILNRPSTLTIKQLDLTVPLPEFDNCPLYVGGDVGGGEISLLHALSGVPGSAEVVRGVYCGWSQAIPAAQLLVQSGRARPSDFRFFARYAGWGPGQLEQECRRGVWYTAAASPAVITTEATGLNGADMWHEVLQLMGGDYERLSEDYKLYEERLMQGKQPPAFGAGDSEGIRLPGEGQADE